MNYVDIPSNYKTGVLKNADAVMASLQNIIATPVGSVPGHPEFGCLMSRYLFEFLDPLIAQLIEEDIRYAVERWEPRVKITKVEVNDDPDYNRIIIAIYFTIKGDTQNQELKYIYKVNV